MSELIDIKRIEAIEKLACSDCDIVQVLTSFGSAYHERQMVSKEIIKCKNDVDLEVLNRMFDHYNDQIKLVLGII